MREVFRAKLCESAKALELCLTEEQIEQFSDYYELLIEWNEKINLTALTEPEDVALKHMIDSLTCYQPKWFGQAPKVIDVGTGAGFPGLPLKIFQPHIELTLLDSLNKRLNFLQATLEKTGITDVKLIHARAEEGARKPELRDQFDLAVSRAVARLVVLAELCLPFVKQGGYFLAMKGAKAQEELDEAKKSIHLLGGAVKDVCPVSLPGLDDQRFIIVIQKNGSTPKSYPRRPGQIEKKPLL